MKRIIVAVDWSAASLRAVEFAADIAGRYGAALLLLTVVSEGLRPDPGIEAFAALEHVKEPAITIAIDGVRNRLSGVRDRALTKGARDVSVDAVLGDAAERILSSAISWEAELIAIGSRGHGRLAGLLFGSVAQKVVTLAACPVVVIH